MNDTPQYDCVELSDVIEDSAKRVRVVATQKSRAHQAIEVIDSAAHWAKRLGCLNADARHDLTIARDAIDKMLKEYPPR